VCVVCACVVWVGEPIAIGVQSLKGVHVYTVLCISMYCVCVVCIGISIESVYDRVCAAHRQAVQLMCSNYIMVYQAIVCIKHS
jgi:hypothetical protein